VLQITVLSVLLALAFRGNTLQLRTEMDFIIIIIIISLLSLYYSYFLLKTSLLSVSTNYTNTLLQALNAKMIWET